MLALRDALAGEDAGDALTEEMEHIDVVVIGAGLSGIGAGYHLQTQCPGRSYAILEAREAMGGTWDLFRYPGVRSDSDMHTLGYSFNPWIAKKAIADGPSILQYIQDTAASEGIDAHIRYRHRLRRARWCSDNARWTLEIEQGPAGKVTEMTCNFLFMCAGYYSYQKGYTPDFDGVDDYQGTIVHPQDWPEDLDYEGKRVAIIGSGATAVTLVPSMAESARHVTMVQRSPTYIVAWPGVDRIANTLLRFLPKRLAYRLTRRKNITLQQFAYGLSRRRPARMRGWLLRRARKAVGPDFDVKTHLTPRYNPWEERLCLAPDGDFFSALRSGKASIVTGQLRGFTQGGLAMEDGREVPADIVVTATGLNLVMLGEVEFSVDGAAIDFANTYTYKGLAYSNVPNLCAAFGYVNASWTLRADLVCAYVCRLLNYMDGAGARQCTPRLAQGGGGMTPRPFIEGFAPGYIQRVGHLFPKQGDREPWLNPQDYALDVRRLTQDRVDDGVMEFLP